MFGKLALRRIAARYRATTNFSCSSAKQAIILGIETSCDDTGAAVVDTSGRILGEALNSQHLIHLKSGGITPPVAEELHRQNIERIVGEAVADVGFDRLDAIAVTVKPGLPLSLMIGMKYGKHLCRKYGKPFIPIHHMEAHALTCRMHDQNVDFPFLVLLISGGHCLLAVVRGVDDFALLGDTLDDAPGEAFDKMARRMKLKNMPDFANLSGGQAIELAASRATDPLQFKFTASLLRYRDCQFSLAGMKNQAWRHIVSQERVHDLPPDGVIPDVYNLCAGLQLSVTRHLCHRVQRAMEYVRIKNLIPPDKQTLVVSGGVACNNFIARALQIVCDGMEYRFIRPPPKLCTDNGVMIAWNGVERYRIDAGVTFDYNSIDVQNRCPFGTNLIDDIRETNIGCKWVRLNVLNKQQTEDDIEAAKLAGRC